MGFMFIQAFTDNPGWETAQKINRNDDESWAKTKVHVIEPVVNKSSVHTKTGKVLPNQQMAMIMVIPIIQIRRQS
jgi:hypothetical protein